MSKSKVELDQTEVERERERIAIKLERAKRDLDLAQKRVKALEDRLANPEGSLRKSLKGRRWYESRKGKGGDPDQLDIERDTKKAPVKKSSSTII